MKKFNWNKVKVGTPVFYRNRDSENWGKGLLLQYDLASSYPFTVLKGNTITSSYDFYTQCKPCLEKESYFGNF